MLNDGTALLYLNRQDYLVTGNMYMSHDRHAVTQSHTRAVVLRREHCLEQIIIMIILCGVSNKNYRKDHNETRRKSEDLSPDMTSEREVS